MTEVNFDPGVYVRQRVLELTRPDVSPEMLRQNLATVIGGIYDWDRPPLEPKVVESVQLDGYRRETVTFTTRPGLTAFGYMLIPDGAKGQRRPAILCLPGHGRGVDSIIGIAEDGTQRKLGEGEEYASDYALQCVARGYTVFALEPIGFGHRRRRSAVLAGPAASSCHEDNMAALMLGETIIGWRVWDCIRALDYLETRLEVDPSRIATMGISGGGLMSLFTGALDTRVAACIVSGYLNTFVDSILSIHHCVDNYAPGLLALGEMADIASLVTPRGFYAESGRADPIFPLASFEKAAEAVAAAYAAAGASDRFDCDIFEGGHRWDGAGVWPFLARTLA